MRTQSRDTNPTVEALQIAGLRRLTPGQRLGIARRLTRGTFAVSWRNFRARYADLDDEGAVVLWVRLLYGSELADRVAAAQARRRGQ